MLGSVLGLVAGCGRGRFDLAPRGDASALGDARPCAPVGHDEDGDGFDDACDACPQIADDQTDSDGDGIGDACDIAATTQLRLLFDPMTAKLDTVWTYSGGTFTGDVLHMSSLNGGTGATLRAAPGRDTYEVLGDLLAAQPSMAQVTISRRDGGSQAYYCELYDDGAALALNFTYTFDNVTFIHVASTNLPTRFDSGPYRLIMDVTPPTGTCIAEWHGARRIIAGAIPAITVTEAGFTVFGVDTEIRSFVRLTTP